MPCKAELRRRFGRRDDALGYLVSRGFLFLPHGWENGRWAATIEHTNGEYIIAIWLRAANAA
jgi:hypothetical protein